MCSESSTSSWLMIQELYLALREFYLALRELYLVLQGFYLAQRALPHHSSHFESSTSCSEGPTSCSESFTSSRLALIKLYLMLQEFYLALKKPYLIAPCILRALPRAPRVLLHRTLAPQTFAGLYRALPTSMSSDSIVSSLCGLRPCHIVTPLISTTSPTPGA